jgi:hypothetical protein
MITPEVRQGRRKEYREQGTREAPFHSYMNPPNLAEEKRTRKVRLLIVQ